ncbi:Hint domain-containing protein [Tateyamaria sp. syn59]|uniref:Hint domain-containing protein n=1 Tax=Tateyamaria sp. syn59 TaxID=2576942 RepID=UPI0011BF2277|nr:Hint domain-containing protein [Tateyamaria sp. syn59]
MPDELLGGIVINEVLVDPNGNTANFDTDGDGTANATDEFVELRNVSDAAIDISGVQLWDAGSDNWFTFPPGTVLQPGAHALVITGVQPGGALPTGGPNDLAFDAGWASALLSNGDDNIVVLDPSSNTYIQATYNGDVLDDPTAGGSNYVGFPSSATRIGAGEDFGSDIDGFSIQRGPGDTFVDDQKPTPGSQNVCFCDGTLISVADGEMPVEDLVPGQLVHSIDQGLTPVVWLHSRELSAEEVNANIKLQPVVIAKGALGYGLPRRDLRVSQQHRMLVCGKIAERMFDTREVLVPAKALTDIDGIRISAASSSMTYFHVALPRHSILLANGAPSESFFPGKQALAALSDAARDEFLTLFPELAEGNLASYGPARTLVKYRRAQKLAMRHRKNRRELVSRFH